MTEINVAGLRLRPFDAATDFPHMARVSNAVFAADGMGWIRTAENISEDYAKFVDFDPCLDIVMAERGGELVGYVRTSNWTDQDGLLVQGQTGFVHPAHRRGGVGTALLQWIERRQREVMQARQAGRSVHHVFVTGGEEGRAEMLRRNGYAVARHFLVMERPTLDDIPRYELPDGFEVRAVQQEHVRAIFEAHMEALRGHWDIATPSPGAFERWTTLASFQPHLWQIAWHIGSNQVAGQVKPFINHEQNAAFNRKRGETEFISVGAQWRRKGIARALIGRALHAQRHAGMTESILGVDAENPHKAASLYEACGFRVVKRNAAFRRPVTLP